MEAPAINGNKVYFTPGGDSISMVALNTETGATIWKSKATSEQTAYCSPLLFEHNSKKYIVTSFTDNIECFDAETGTFLWKISQKNRYSIHPNTPIYKDGCVYSISGYKTGGVMIKLSDDGKTATEIWRNESMDNQIGGAVWLDKYIVSSGHENDREWQALDAQTGKVTFKTDSLGKGAVVYADGLYYCYADNGVLGILELKDNGFSVKSKFRITLGSDQHWAHPVIDKGIMYIRHGNTLMAYSIKQ